MSFTTSDLTLGAVSFAPGFMDTPEEDALPAGATPDALNGILLKASSGDDVRAILAKRTGHRLLNATAISAEKRVDGLTWFKRTGADDELVVVCDGVAYKINSVSGAVTALTSGSGFTAGRVVTFLEFKDNLDIMDGTHSVRYNGTACFPIGFDKPTAAPALTQAAGPGVTGTYEGYAVWYDSVTDHESSPSAVSAAVVFANQQRQWTKPTGSPPSNVNFWRVYARRVDTNENQFYRVGSVAIGTGTLTEALIDGARTQAGLGPLNDTNDTPPEFAHAEEWNGYRVGVPKDSADAYVSRALDHESQHPKDVFPIGGKNDAKPVRSVRKFGKRLMFRKPTATYEFVGDKLPFIVNSVAPEWGGVSQRSGVEVGSYWYDWDERHGPYRTDFSSWEALGDTRIKEALARANMVALNLIECVIYPRLLLLIWAVPLVGMSKKRLLLPYHYGLGAWLPPITGFEWSGMTEFIEPTTGADGLYAGDEWGRVYEMFSGAIDGVPSGTIDGIITASTSTKITCAAAAFFITGQGLAGMPCVVVSPSGAEQWVRIKSNTATELTLDSSGGSILSPVPTPTGWTVIVGAINWYHCTPRETGGDAFVGKSAGWLYVQAGLTSVEHRLRCDVRLNRATSSDRTLRFSFPASGLVWGSGYWGEAWGSGGTRGMVKHRLRRSYKDVQLRFSNYHPNQPVELVSYKITADWLRRRQAKSNAA